MQMMDRSKAAKDVNDLPDGSTYELVKSSPGQTRQAQPAADLTGNNSIRRMSEHVRQEVQSAEASKMALKEYMPAESAGIGLDSPIINVVTATGMVEEQKDQSIENTERIREGRSTSRMNVDQEKAFSSADQIKAEDNEK